MDLTFDIVYLENLQKRVTIIANFTILTVRNGEYHELDHAIVMHLCGSGQFDTINIYNVKKFEMRHKYEIEKTFPNIKVYTEGRNGCAL
jgi:hypothetical protein